MEMIVPDVREVRLPMTTGVVGNVPFASLSWTLKTFPELKLAETVYGTFMVFPAQNGLPLIVPVLIVCDCKRKQAIVAKKRNIRKILIADKFNGNV